MPTPLCNHRFLDGHTCGSPSLRGEPFCYFHHPNRRPKITPWHPAPPAKPYARRTREGFQLSAPKNRQELNLALGVVIQKLASNRLDVHRATALLYSLELASRNL